MTTKSNRLADEIERSWREYISDFANSHRTDGETFAAGYRAALRSSPASVPSEEELRAALADLLTYAERNECEHEETHRGGFIWTICSQCGRKWADDEGGFQAYEEPEPLTRARALLSREQGNDHPKGGNEAGVVASLPGEEEIARALITERYGPSSADIIDNPAEQSWRSTLREARAILALFDRARLSPTVVDDSAPAGETAPDPVAADGIVEFLRARARNTVLDRSASLLRQAADLIERHPSDLARARAEGRREMAEGAAKAFDMLHDSLLSNGPKQASGEQAAYWRDRFRSLAEKNNG